MILGKILLYSLGLSRVILAKKKKNVPIKMDICSFKVEIFEPEILQFLPSQGTRVENPVATELTPTEENCRRVQ